MAWVTPTTVSTGDVLTASRYNADVQANLTELAPFFSAWTSWTPVVTQGGTVTVTNNDSKYVKVGRLVIGRLYVTVTGSGSGGTAVTITLPVAQPAALPVVGAGWIYDANPGTRYNFTMETPTTTTFAMTGDWSGNTTWGASPNLALAAADQIRCMFAYEAAS